MRAILLGDNFSGKSTLAEAISDRYAWKYIPELLFLASSINELLDRYQVVSESLANTLLQQLTQSHTDLHRIVLDVYKDQPNIVVDRGIVSEYILSKQPVQAPEESRIPQLVTQLVKAVRELTVECLEHTDAVFLLQPLAFSEQNPQISQRPLCNCSSYFDVDLVRSLLLELGFTNLYTIPSAPLEERLQIFEQTIRKIEKEK